MDDAYGLLGTFEFSCGGQQVLLLGFDLSCGGCLLGLPVFFTLQKYRIGLIKSQQGFLVFLGAAKSGGYLCVQLRFGVRRLRTGPLNLGLFGFGGGFFFEPVKCATCDQDLVAAGFKAGRKWRWVELGDRVTATDLDSILGQPLKRDLSFGGLRYLERNIFNGLQCPRQNQSTFEISQPAAH